MGVVATDAARFHELTTSILEELATIVIDEFGLFLNRPVTLFCASKRDYTT